MSKLVTPVVMSDDRSRHEPLKDGEAVAISAIPLSADRKNLIETDDTGLLLTGKMLVSELEHNPIIDNVDGRLYVRVRSMLSPEDKVLKVSDNLVRADVSMRFDPDTSRLSLLGKDNAVLSEIALPVAPGLPVVVELLQDFTPPAPEGFVESPYPEGTYLHMRFLVEGGKETDIYLDVSKLVDIYTGGRGIAVENNKISIVIKDGSALYIADCCDAPDCSCGGKLDISIPALVQQIVSPDDKIIGASDGKLTTELRLAYDPDQRIITLLGKDDVSLGEVKIPETELPDIPNLPIDAEFVDTPAGLAPGKYLHLVFKLADGTMKDLYLDVTELVDVYEGGGGITVSGKVISVKLGDSDDNALMLSNAGNLYVNKSRLVSKMPDNLLSVSDVDNKLYVKDAGLDKDDLGLGLALDADKKVNVDMQSLVMPGTGLVVGAGNLLGIDLDALAALLADKLKVGISADEGNILSVGSDGKPYYPGNLGSL